MSPTNNARNLDRRRRDALGSDHRRSVRDQARRSMKPYRLHNQFYEPAKSFKEIAAAMGITPSGAWMLYKNALRKLRKQPEALAKLRAMAEELQRSRPENPYEDIDL
jgi:hypothetical protein